MEDIETTCFEDKKQLVYSMCLCGVSTLMVSAYVWKVTECAATHSFRLQAFAYVPFATCHTWSYVPSSSFSQNVKTGALLVLINAFCLHNEMNVLLSCASPSPIIHLHH